MGRTADRCFGKKRALPSFFVVWIQAYAHGPPLVRELSGTARKQQKPGPTGPGFFAVCLFVLRTGGVAGVQAMVRLMAAEPIVKELLIQGFDDGGLVGFAQLHAGILIVQGLRAQRLEIGGVAHGSGLEGLAAAVDAAARAAHDLDEMPGSRAVLDAASRWRRRSQPRP